MTVTPPESELARAREAGANASLERRRRIASLMGLAVAPRPAVTEEPDEQKAAS